MSNPTSLYWSALKPHTEGASVRCLEQAQQLIKPNPALLEKMSLQVLVPATTFLSAAVYVTEGHRVS